MKVTAIKRQRFAEEFCVDFNLTQAAIRVGYSEASARDTGSQLFALPDVQERVRKQLAILSERTTVDAQKVLERWWAIATANPGEIMQHRRGACRHCWGLDHRYQWVDDVELEEAQVRAGEDQFVDFSGGFGYNRNKRPHKRCPRCSGEGVTWVHLADTRNLSAAGLLLFDGVKESRFGIEVKIQDRAKALEMVARHLGMFTDKLELGGPGGGAIPHEIRRVIVDPQKK